MSALNCPGRLNCSLSSWRLANRNIDVARAQLAPYSGDETIIVVERYLVPLPATSQRPSITIYRNCCFSGSATAAAAGSLLP